MQIKPTDIQSYLKGIDYPATKDEVVDHAKQNNAPGEIMDNLNRLPDETYNSPVEVSENLNHGQ